MSTIPVVVANGRVVHNLNGVEKQIVIVKQPQSAIIPNRRESALRRIEMIQSEMGRMQKLLDELRADVLHLTVE